jgi:hypothetical protein
MASLGLCRRFTASQDISGPCSKGDAPLRAVGLSVANMQQSERGLFPLRQVHIIPRQSEQLTVGAHPCIDGKDGRVSQVLGRLG